MFWIGFTKEQLVDAEPGENYRIGTLSIGSHEERFVAHMNAWSEPQYIEHWRSALVRAMDGKAAALITDMRTPTESSHLVWWPLWKIGSDLVFHNQLLFFAQHKVEGSKIDPECLYGLTGEPKSHSDDGTPLSEWSVPLADVDLFLKNRP